jgi:hypothetical protein
MAWRVTSYTRWVDAVQVIGAENQEVYLTFSPRYTEAASNPGTKCSCFSTRFLAPSLGMSQAKALAGFPSSIARKSHERFGSCDFSRYCDEPAGWVAGKLVEDSV